MIFKRMLGALGVGAPSVDTVLAAHRVQPGAPLTGEVRVKAGEYDADIEYVALGLIARVESERTESERIGTMEFLRSEVAGPSGCARTRIGSSPSSSPRRGRCPSPRSRAGA